MARTQDSDISSNILLSHVIMQPISEVSGHFDRRSPFFDKIMGSLNDERSRSSPDSSFVTSYRLRDPVKEREAIREGALGGSGSERGEIPENEDGSSDSGSDRLFVVRMKFIQS